MNFRPAIKMPISPFNEVGGTNAPPKPVSVPPPGVGGDDHEIKPRKLLPCAHAQSGADIGSASNDSDESDDEQFQSVDMEALRQRGKGSYSCPKGTQCKKGGVDKDGQLIVFDRNSSFAYVATIKLVPSFILSSIFSSATHSLDASVEPGERQDHY